jgi:hypothetical protein
MLLYEQISEKSESEENIMDMNKVTSALQCYIDLSLFDPFTGESFDKDFLDGRDKDRVTACEEALKLLEGADEASLAMPKDEIRNNLEDIYNLFKKENEEDRAHGTVPNELNAGAEEGFKAALDFIDGSIEKTDVQGVTSFDCDNDLSKYTDSLLFCSGDVAATMTMEDDRGYSLSMELIVTGDVNVEFEGEIYTSPDDFPPELKQAVKEGRYDDIQINSNNWFELVYSLTDSKGKEIACDGDVWESDISKMTAEQLKADMQESGVRFIEHTIDREHDEPEI